MNAAGFPSLGPAGLTVEDFKRSIAEKLYYALARFPAVATRNDHYLAADRQRHGQRLRTCHRQPRAWLRRRLRNGYRDQ